MGLRGGSSHVCSQPLVRAGAPRPVEASVPRSLPPVCGQSLCSNSLLFLRTLSLDRTHPDDLKFITSAKTLLLNEATPPGDRHSLGLPQAFLGRTVRPTPGVVPQPHDPTHT